MKALTILILLITASLSHTFQLYNNRLFKKIASTVICTGILFNFNNYPVSADAIPVIGADAPGFNLPSNDNGKVYSLADINNKRTVLYFYPGDFTSGCTIEAQNFEKNIDEFKSLNVQIIGVSVDSVSKHLDFSKKYGLDFPLLSDVDGLVSNKYGSLLDLGFIGKFSNRQTYIISPKGKIEYVFTDVESRINQHATDVLSKLKTLN